MYKKRALALFFVLGLLMTEAGICSMLFVVIFIKIAFIIAGNLQNHIDLKKLRDTEK